MLKLLGDSVMKSLGSHFVRNFPAGADGRCTDFSKNTWSASHKLARRVSFSVAKIDE